MPASSLGYHGRPAAAAQATPTTTTIAVAVGEEEKGGGWLRDVLGVLFLVAAGVGVGLWAAFAR